MGYSKLVVVVSVLYFKDDLVKSDHSNCAHQVQLTAFQHLQVQEDALTERAHWKWSARRFVKRILLS